MPRRAYDKAYARYRREKRGPDPRNTARWRKLRAMVLARHPLCADPYGVHAATGVLPLTEDVDHIQGVWAAPERVFDVENLQGLCRMCHARKSGSERRRTTDRDPMGGTIRLTTR
jgi:5-methylcytosine-specific restriction protein A